jgi:hypothetical protein
MGASKKKPPNRKQRRKNKLPKHVADPRIPCTCRKCRHKAKAVPKWPRHYMGIPVRQDRDRPSPEALQSYECHIEGETVDPELLEELAALRNEPERIGGVIVERRRRL